MLLWFIFRGNRVLDLHSEGKRTFWNKGTLFLESDDDFETFLQSKDILLDGFSMQIHSAMQCNAQHMIYFLFYIHTPKQIKASSSICPQLFIHHRCYLTVKVRTYTHAKFLVFTIKLCRTWKLQPLHFSWRVHFLQHNAV